MTDVQQTCDVCEGQSGSAYVGVLSLTGAPMSVAFCQECARRDAAPWYIFEHDYFFVASGNLDNLTSWARQRETWFEGRYWTFDDFVARYTPEMETTFWARVERDLEQATVNTANDIDDFSYPVK